MHQTIFKIAFDIFKANFVPLIVAIGGIQAILLVYSLLLIYVFGVQPQGASDQISGSKFLLVYGLEIVLFPFIYASSTYLLYKSFRRESWQYSFAILSGVKYWNRLLLATMLRVILIILFALVFNIILGGGGGDRSLMLIFYFILMLGVLYILIRTGFFDFFIVVEQESALSSLKKSYELTRDMAALAISVIAPAVLLTVLIFLVVLSITKAVIVQLVVQAILSTVFFAFVQSLMFTLYWIRKNRKPPSESLSSNDQPPSSGDQ